jgi:hypothetical protein
MGQVRDKVWKDAFIKYMADNPSERFFQAVRNFSHWPFLIVSNELPKEGQEDTFYWEGPSNEGTDDHPDVTTEESP